MGNVGWNLCNPDLSLPGDLIHMLFELPEIRKGADIHPGGNAILEGDFQLLHPLGGHGAVRRDGLNQEHPVSLFVVEHHIRQLVMLGNGNAEMGQLVPVQVQELVGSVAQVQLEGDEMSFTFMKSTYLACVLSASVLSGVVTAGCWWGTDGVTPSNQEAHPGQYNSDGLLGVNTMVDNNIPTASITVQGTAVVYDSSLWWADYLTITTEPDRVTVILDTDHNINLSVSSGHNITAILKGDGNGNAVVEVYGQVIRQGSGNGNAISHGVGQVLLHYSVCRDIVLPTRKGASWRNL